VSGRVAPTLFFVALALAIGGVGWLAFRNAAPEAPPPEPGTAAPTPSPAPPEAKGRTGRPKKPPLPPEPPIPATPEACLAFLEEQAGPPGSPKGGTVIAQPGVREDALDALVALPGRDATPDVLRALGGDGDPAEWGEARLHAAALRIRRGQADGAETLKAYVREEKEPAGNDASAEAAKAAAWLGGAEGAAAMRLLLVPDLSAYDADALTAVLQAATTLGAGATAADARRVLDAREGEFDTSVLGAAAGLLLRLGDPTARKALDAAMEDGFFVEEFAAGLGAPGNGAVVPWLEELARNDDLLARAGAARALGDVGGPAAGAALRRLLEDADADVRAESAVSLALLGDKDVLPRVRAALSIRDDDLRIRAWRALALLGDPAAKEDAVRLLGEPSPNLRDPFRGPAVRQRIWAALLLLKTSGTR
jgi:hypothetical protein